MFNNKKNVYAWLRHRKTSHIHMFQLGKIILKIL